MILSREDKKMLIDRFPSLELSYENTLHKKVHADVFILIPNGEKSFVWFTYWKDKNVCLVLILNDNNNICDIVNYPVCFDSKLSLNTVMYGTLFKNNNLTHFTCEQIFYYKNENVIQKTFLDKLTLIKRIFDHDIKQIAYTTDFLILGLPIMKTNYDHMLACINGLPYSIYGIQFVLIRQHSILQNAILGIYKINKPFSQEAIFIVKPTIDQDIYNLYCNVTQTQTQTQVYGIATIPSYKCSVMMNSLFRNIKENINLDLLEESDDDDEYENTNADKYVKLDTSYNMRCIYNRRFKKWQPIEVVDSKYKLISFKEAQQLEK